MGRYFCWGKGCYGQVHGETGLENIDNMCMLFFVSWFILKCNQSTELVRKDHSWIIGWTGIFLRRTSVLFEDSVHPGRLTWNLQITHLEGKWSSKPSWLCSMLIFRGVIIKTRSIPFWSWSFQTHFKTLPDWGLFADHCLCPGVNLDGYFDGGWDVSVWWQPEIRWSLTSWGKGRIDPINKQRFKHHPRWLLGISSINSMIDHFLWIQRGAEWKARRSPRITGVYSETCETVVSNQIV